MAIDNNTNFLRLLVFLTSKNVNQTRTTDWNAFQNISPGFPNGYWKIENITIIKIVKTNIMESN